MKKPAAIIEKSRKTLLHIFKKVNPDPIVYE